MIAKETESEILRLFHAEKWRVGTIAEQLGLHHTTVQRVVLSFSRQVSWGATVRENRQRHSSV